MGENKDCLPIASPTTADHTASMPDALQTSFDAPQETLVHLGLAVRWEQDPSLSESHSWDLLLGALLCAMPPSALRKHIQMPHRLDAKPDFVADFHLTFPVASSQPLRLLDGRWELGTSIQTAMVKSSAQIVTHL